MKSKKGFTLIELLVVIAIIALLLSIIMPALRKVKKQAMSIVCLSNLRSITTCWHTYATDNSENMVNGHAPHAVYNRPYFWVEAAQDESGNYTGQNAINGTQLLEEDEERGIKKGLLYPYVETVDVYHCPADKSKKIFSPLGSYRNSYSITGMMNGECGEEAALIDPSANYFRSDKAVKKITKVKSPSNKVVLIENTDERGMLFGSWVMYPTVPAWNDRTAIWHGNTTMLGYADGHADSHKWVDKTTIENAAGEKPFVKTPPPDEQNDVMFMARSYLP